VITLVSEFAFKRATCAATLWRRSTRASKNDDVKLHIYLFDSFGVLCCSDMFIACAGLEEVVGCCCIIIIVDV
jgi:hypothetical protein